MRLDPPFVDLFGLGHPQLEVSPAGESIVTFGDEASDVWDIASGNRTCASHDDQLIQLVDWSPEGRSFLASSHGWAKIVDRNGREIQVLREDDGYHGS